MKNSKEIKYINNTNKENERNSKVKYPKYSVLMSVYKNDNPKWLTESIECMLNQTIKCDEFIIVEDGPLTNELNEVIDKYLKNYSNLFNIVKIEKNGGLGPALKLGVENCKNEWIARMDADDYSPSDRIKKQFEIILKNKDVGIVGSNAVEFIDKIENVVARVILPETNDEIVKFSKKRCPYRHSGIIYKKSEIISAGNYQECYLCEDYDLYSRMEMNGTKGYNVQEDLLYVRVNPEFYGRRGGIKYLKSILKFKKRLLKSGFYSKKDYLISTGSHVLVCLMPNKLREFIYIKLLRK